VANEAEVRLERLLDYLEQDRDNQALATECAEAALAANRIELAQEILAPLLARGTLDAAGMGLAGIAAMRGGNQEIAQRIFADHLAEAPDDVGTRFNLAWSQALSNNHQAARATLGDVSETQLPQAATLDLQLAHHLGDFEEAEAKIPHYLARFPDYPPLNAAIALLAMDMDRPELAREAALRGGEHPDALAALGTFELGDNRHDEARELFVRSLAIRAHNARANIGLGLVNLATGNSADALEHLDRGAEQFGDHLGAWLAAGWAHCLAGDATGARERFETALRHDDTFGEAQGSLAAIEAMAGNFEAAKQRLEIARRLDREAFSVAFTAMILAAADGDQAKAQRIFEIASKQPLGPGGSTLAEALAKMAM
jgi:tetratricopeptide (TPR) repeat protein